MQNSQGYNDRYHREDSSHGPSLGSKLIGSLIKRIVLSPLVVFLVGYFYFGQDVQKGILAALYFYTAYTLLLIVMKIFGILTSAVTFRPFKVIKKSIDLVIMLIALAIYWFVYSLWFQGNFILF